MTMPPDPLFEIIRRDFHAFIHRSFLELNPGATFLDNWHIAAIAAALERVRYGACRRLIICMPPRSLKSHCVSIAFPAWLLGHIPAEQIITVSYAQELADKLARDCRALMTKAFFKALFSARLSPIRQAVSEFETTQQGFRLSTSIGGSLTGRGANFILIDDALKPEEALSDASRERVNDWFANTLYSRLNDKSTGAIVVVMQRLHEADLVGKLLSEGGWELLSFPAIAECDQAFHWITPYGPRRHVRRIGDVLHPAREPREILEGIRKTLGSYSFAGQYQQSPAPYGGGLVKEEWFKRYDEQQMPGQFDFVVQSWDTANKANDLANYSACTTWGIKGKTTYLLDALRQRLGYLELKLSVKRQARRFGARVILIEDKASGTQLIEDLIADRVAGVTRYKPEGDKILRMSVQTAAVESGEVYLPRSAPWLEEYLHELLTFPKGRFSDQVDSTSQALDWIKQHRNNVGDMWLEFYKRLAAGPSAPELVGPTRIMAAPAGVTASRSSDGRVLTRRADGLFDVPEDLVQLMMHAGWRCIS